MLNYLLFKTQKYNKKYTLKLFSILNFLSVQKKQVQIFLFYKTPLNKIIKKYT